MALLPLVVVETESGAEVRLRDADEGERYGDVFAALDSLLADEDFAAREPGLRDERGKPIGAWRWLDATAEEPAPAADGSQVTRDLIARMAARLNSGSPVPIDGVSSEPHQQLYATGTHADGYGHVGAEVQDRSGRWHLWLYAELGPEAARVTSQGLVWSGSIGFTSDGRLLQHALTNVPAVEGLRPNNATRHAARRVFTRSLRITMPPKTHARGPAADILAKIAAILGVSMDAEKDADFYESPLMDALHALKGAAKVEDVLDAASGAPAGAEAATATDAAAPARAARVLPGFADEAEQDAFTAQILGALGDVFGQPEASPAQLLELLTASLAAFKGALGEAAPPENAAGDAAAMTATESARAVADVGGLRARVAELEASIAKRDLRASIAKRAAEAKASIGDADLDTLTGDVLSVTDPGARERVIVSALRAAQSIPSGDVFARGAQAGAAPADFTAAWRSLLPEVEKAHAGEAQHVHIARAQKLARARFPQFTA